MGRGRRAGRLLPGLTGSLQSPRNLGPVGGGKVHPGSLGILLVGLIVAALGFQRSAPGEVQSAPARCPVGGFLIFPDRAALIALSQQRIAPVFQWISPARSFVMRVPEQYDGSVLFAARQPSEAPLGVGKGRRRSLSDRHGKPPVG